MIGHTPAANAMLRGRKWERALELLYEMRGREVELDAIGCSASLGACESGRP